MVLCELLVTGIFRSHFYIVDHRIACLTMAFIQMKFTSHSAEH